MSACEVPTALSDSSFYKKSFALMDAYIHIQIVPYHRPFLRFTLKGVTYPFTALPFVLSLAMHTFTKCMTTALSPLRQKELSPSESESKEICSQVWWPILRIRALHLKSVPSSLEQTFPSMSILIAVWQGEVTMSLLSSGFNCSPFEEHGQPVGVFFGQQWCGVGMCHSFEVLLH